MVSHYSKVCPRDDIVLLWGRKEEVQEFAKSAQKSALADELRFVAVAKQSVHPQTIVQPNYSAPVTM